MAEPLDQGDYWAVFTVRPCGERLAALWLTNIGVRHALPMATRLARRSRHQKARPKKEKYVAMRGYIFAYVPPGVMFTNFRNRISNPSIVRPVGFNGQPLTFRLPVNWEDHLDPAVLDPECLEPLPIVVGDAVVITDEWRALTGYTGRVDSIRGHEVAIVLDGLMVALVKLPVNGVKKLAA
jgi:hypothetical protein